MKYHIHLQPDAVADLDGFRKYDVTRILDGITEHLQHRPTLESKSRIKKLRGKQSADYRLRIDDFRVFYSVQGETVKVLRILSKKQTQDFYQ